MVDSCLGLKMVLVKSQDLHDLVVEDRESWRNDRDAEQTMCVLEVNPRTCNRIGA